MKPFNVFGATVAIEFVKELENAGEYCPNDRLIKICRDKNKDKEKLALLHEMVHAICDRCGISQAIPNELEEILCENISHAFFENFYLRRK